MTAYGKFRGHVVYWDGEQYRYESDGAPTGSHWRDRGCGHCGMHETPEGYDGCIGHVPGAVNACCGHGNEREAYVQLPGGEAVRGQDALNLINGVQAMRCLLKDLVIDAHDPGETAEQRLAYCRRRAHQIMYPQWAEHSEGKP